MSSSGSVAFQNLKRRKIQYCIKVQLNFFALFVIIITPTVLKISWALNFSGLDVEENAGHIRKFTFYISAGCRQLSTVENTNLSAPFAILPLARRSRLIISAH